MKIVNIIGGLGNQMFQYAFAIALKEKYPLENIYIDTQHYKFPFVKKFRGNNFYHNGYELNTLFNNIKIPLASWWNIMKVSYYVPNYIISRIVRYLLPKRKKEFIQGYLNAFIYYKEVFEENEKSYFEGYWMSPKYFDFCRNKVLESFQFPPFDTSDNILYEKILRTKSSVTIHVRRGDYLKSDIFSGICSLEYYKNAIIKACSLLENPIFLIFSNDSEWCIENFKEVLGNNKVYFISNNKGSNSYRDMQLMSKARCNIIANSSFSWWGAYLNKRGDQIVIVPNKWTNQLEDKDIYLDNWIRI